MHANMPLRTRPGSSRPEPDFYRHVAGLEEKLATLRGQVRQAQQLAGLGTATATLAHEVNNLITPIVGYAHGALENDNEALQKKALQVTIKNARMLVAMSDRILRISAAKPTQVEVVPVRECADEAVECLCRDLGKDGITFRNEIDQGVCVRADGLALQQVFFNLFLNARDAMAPSHGGTLSVHARRAWAGIQAEQRQTEDRIEIKIKDTGGGIPEGLLPFVFEPLQSSKRADGSRPARCSGLGLALCRDLIVENGGTIAVSTDLGIGTTFTIQLPAAP
ncbi:MAG: sensor histidine kinase [Phycisphaerae bacterium]